MAALLEGGYDLGALTACYIAIGLLIITAALVDAVAGLFDFSIFGLRPLHGIAAGLHNGVVGALDGAIKDLEKVAAGFESGLIDAFGLLIAVPLLLGLGVKAALEYLWSSALKPLIHSITDTIKATAEKALARATGLEGVIAADLAAAEAYTRSHVAGGLADAEAYVEARLRSELHAVSGDIAAAISSAERYADTAVSKLRAAEDLAVAGAVGLAAEAKAAGELAGRAALAAAEAEFGPEIAAARAAAAAGLAALDTATKAALAGIDGVVIDVEHDLAEIEGAIGALGVGALIASLPALATLVHAIATETGLENAECRGKVKGICGTDPAGWAGLLEGALLLTGALSLRELVPIGRSAIADLSGLIREAA